MNLRGKTLVLASHNAGKLKELTNKLDPFDVTLLPLTYYGIEAPEETGTTFEANATLKAKNAALKTGEWALADDSGLKVKALGGRPGVYSADWGGEEQDFKKAVSRIHDELLEISDPDWSAAFECCLALSDPQGNVTLFKGEIEGAIVMPARGSQNFGYDAAFQPLGYTKTFGEMAFEEKQNTRHHRMVAVEQFLNTCFK